MSQTNLRKSSSQCEVILTRPYERLTIDYNSECCRVTAQDAYLKAECFSSKGNHKFRVRIEIESVADDEVSRPQQKCAGVAVDSVYVDGVFQYDPNCSICQSNLSHPYDRHFYTILSEEKATGDYASCNHIWKNEGEGLPYCRKCGNVKLTRKANAEST